LPDNAARAIYWNKQIKDSLKAVLKEDHLKLICDEFPDSNMKHREGLSNILKIGQKTE